MRAVFLSIFFAISLLSSAQKAQEALDKLYKLHPQEKVVLSFSKPDYVAGETIFFKAYVLTGYEPSEVSTNLYAELYDRNKKLIAKQIIPLLNGAGRGNFSLPTSLEENVYYVRAYTRFMLNYPEAFQYIKPLNIYNPYSSKILRSKPVQWTAATFVEGGILLNAVPTNISVRLTTTGMLPKNWKANLVDKQTGTSTPVTVFNNEVGSVALIPEGGRNYIILVKDDNGNSHEIALPMSVDTGAVLHLYPQENSIAYEVITKHIAGNGAGYKVVATVDDQTVFAATIKKSTGAVHANIDVSKLPASVLHVTLFDEHEKAVSERLCFIHQQTLSAPATIKTDTLSVAEKGYNSWKLSVDSTSWPSYFVQVSDASLNNENPFLGDLYLNSDFPSSIQNAPWYFDAVTETKMAALDALLITEKWRRFAWDDLLHDRFPSTKLLPEKFLSYKATVFKGKKLQPLKDVNLLLKGKDSTMQFMQVRTDSSGSFAIDNVIFLDTIKVYYQANSRKFFDRDVSIDFESLNKFVPYKSDFTSAQFETVLRTNTDSIPQRVKMAIAQKQNERLAAEKERMQEVVITTTVKNATEELDKKLSSGLFNSINATVFDFVNENQSSAQGYSNILDWLQGRVAGLTTGEREGVVIPLIRNQPAQIFLDEVPVEAEVISGISPSNIAMIKVIKGNFVGSVGGGSAIAIYTARGGLQPLSATPVLPSNFIVGYPLPKAFPIPDYARSGMQNVADVRSVLYRNDNLEPVENKVEVALKFYNNDNAKSFRVLMIGFTKSGDLVYVNKFVK